jgi:hypothetical protein
MLGTRRVGSGSIRDRAALALMKDARSTGMLAI